MNKEVKSADSHFSVKKLILVVGCICVILAVSCVCAFATEGATTSTFTISSDTVSPITSAINSGLTTLVPIGIGIMATFIGVHLIKRVIYMFL